MSIRKGAAQGVPRHIDDVACVQNIAANPSKGPCFANIESGWPVESEGNRTVLSDDNRTVSSHRPAFSVLGHREQNKYECSSILKPATANYARCIHVLECLV
jgi:hypothetical protein